MRTRDSSLLDVSRNASHKEKWDDESRIEGEMEHYEVLDAIAHGSNADLYLAARRGALGVDTLMVVKRMQEAHARDASAVDSFLQEARISVRLRHPNIVTTFGCGEDRGIPYLSMEYLEGGSLRDIAKRCKDKGVRLAPDLVVFIACEVLKGLHHAHTLRDYDGTPLCFVHRDLSPHNVIVTYDGYVKLIDFGIAKTTLQEEKTATGIVKGKCAYVSPEQVAGDPLDPRTDIFSLGIVLWELLTGRRLMNGQSTYEILMAVLNNPSPPPSMLVPGIPVGLDAVVTKALARDPNERFESADAMRKALRNSACLDGKPMASGEDLAAVMSVLFGDERAQNVEAIQRKMGALGRGQRASESGPFARIPASTIPSPPTSSVRLVRDRVSEEEATRFDPDFKVPAAALAQLEQLLEPRDTSCDAPQARHRDAPRDTTESAPMVARAMEAKRDAWEQDNPRLASYTDPLPGRIASPPPPPMMHQMMRQMTHQVPPSMRSLQPSVVTVETRRAKPGKPRERMKSSVRWALLVTDALVFALVATIAVRAPLPNHGRQNFSEVRAEGARIVTTVKAAFRNP